MKAITRAARVLTLILCVWIAASYGEIVTHNTQPNPHYNTYNFFMEVLENV